MIASVRNIFSIPDLRKRVLFTLGLLAVYRLGAQIPNPGINADALQALFESAKGSVFGFVDLFSGRNLSRMTIFALNIMPYISASIILQLLTVVWPYMEKLSKEGDTGRKKITQYTRYGTVVLSIVQSLGIAIGLESLGNTPGGHGAIVLHPGWGFRLLSVLTLTTGTAFIMWLGEQITERGIGNGISLIIFAGIVVGLPHAMNGLIEGLRSATFSVLQLVPLVVMMVAVVAIIVFVERGQRRIVVQYAKRVVGRRMMGGQSTHLPLRVNTGGVIPVIFASSIIVFPATLAKLLHTSWGDAFAKQLGWGMPLYNLFYVAGIIFFCYFYVAIIFNPNDVADNLQKYGGFIPGIRPGKRTAEYIDKILTRITMGGAVYLALIAILPEFLMAGFKVAPLPFIGPWLDNNLPKFVTEGMHIDFYFGGTSLLIVVGVAMDTMQQIESQLIMRHYDGFMKSSRMRGRRG